MTRRKRTESTFVFPAALGARLRDLRLKARLTQSELALRMGRMGRGGQNIVSRLERGALRFPTLALIADFLRGCRAGFPDIAAELHAYTSRPLVADEAAADRLEPVFAALPRREAMALFKYDLKRAIAPRYPGRRDVPARPVPACPESREERARRMYQRAAISDKLEDALCAVLALPDLAVPRDARAPACAYGRSVFRALTETRADPSGRERRLARAWKKASREGVRPATAAAVLDAVQKTFGKLETHGTLDRLPCDVELANLGRRLQLFRSRRAENTLADLEREPWTKYRLHCQIVRLQAGLDAAREAERRHFDFATRRRMMELAQQASDIALAARERSEDRTAVIEHFIAAHPGSDLVPEVVRIALRTFDLYAPSLPPRPEGPEPV